MKACIFFPEFTFHSYTKNEQLTYVLGQKEGIKTQNGFKYLLKKINSSQLAQK